MDYLRYNTPLWTMSKEDEQELMSLFPVPQSSTPSPKIQELLNAMPRYEKESFRMLSYEVPNRDFSMVKQPALRSSQKVNSDRDLSFINVNKPKEITNKTSKISIGRNNSQTQSKIVPNGYHKSPTQGSKQKIDMKRNPFTLKGEPNPKVLEVFKPKELTKIPLGENNFERPSKKVPERDFSLVRPQTQKPDKKADFKSNFPMLIDDPILQFLESSKTQQLIKKTNKNPKKVNVEGPFKKRNPSMLIPDPKQKFLEETKQQELTDKTDHPRNGKENRPYHSKTANSGFAFQSLEKSSTQLPLGPKVPPLPMNRSFDVRSSKSQSRGLFSKEPFEKSKCQSIKTELEKTCQMESVKTTQKSGSSFPATKKSKDGSILSESVKQKIKPILFVAATSESGKKKSPKPESLPKLSPFTLKVHKSDPEKSNPSRSDSPSISGTWQPKPIEETQERGSSSSQMEYDRISSQDSKAIQIVPDLRQELEDDLQDLEELLSKDLCHETTLDAKSVDPVNYLKIKNFLLEGLPLFDQGSNWNPEPWKRASDSESSVSSSKRARYSDVSCDSDHVDQNLLAINQTIGGQVQSVAATSSGNHRDKICSLPGAIYEPISPAYEGQSETFAPPRCIEGAMYNKIHLRMTCNVWKSVPTQSYQQPQSDPNWSLCYPQQNYASYNHQNYLQFHYREW